MAVEVKPTGEHGKKKWCVMRDGAVSMVCETNSEACLVAAELAKAGEEGEAKGVKKGTAAEKKKAPEVNKPPTTAPVTKTVKRGGKKR